MKDDTVRIYKALFENEEDRKLKKRLECEHAVWRCICSCCGKTLSSEKLHENVPIDEILI